MSATLTKKQALEALNAIQPPNELIDPIINRINTNVTDDEDVINDVSIINEYNAAIAKGPGGGPPSPSAGGPDAQGFTETDGYKIKKEDDAIKGKVTNATDAFRVQKDNNEYLVFKGQVLSPMTGGQKKSKSQKRGGKKQRQTKRKMGGRRRSNRRR